MSCGALIYQNKHIDLYYDNSRNTAWYVYDPGATGCVSLDILNAVKDVNAYLESSGLVVKFIVGMGKYQDVYCTGGDLELFVTAIKHKDKELLREYAYRCIEDQYLRNQSKVLSSNPVVISLVRGLALGGGFEFALASPFVVAEANAKFALPEAAFNLFPGMGGFPYLYQKTGDIKFTESAILSGAVIPNEELVAKGVIDKLVPEGKGIQAVNGLIDSLTPRFINVQATLWTKNLLAGVPYEVLATIADRWVEDAFKLSDTNLAYMERLVSQQKKKLVKFRQVS